MLLDVATEELSHLEVVGSIITMMNKGLKAQLAEGQTHEGNSIDCRRERYVRQVIDPVRRRTFAVRLGWGSLDGRLRRLARPAHGGSPLQYRRRPARFERAST